MQLNRRIFLSGLAVGGTAAKAGLLAAPAAKQRFELCAFVKFLQSMSHDALAASIAELGFDGIEATVRTNGQVLPERVADDLPPLVESLAKHGLQVTIMASSVNSVDQPHTRRVLETAAKLGIRRYRLWNYRYDLKSPIEPQLANIGAQLRDLVAMSRELGLTALYQNHAGADYVGSVVWDMLQLLREYPASDAGLAFDIRHATVEGGLGWPLHFQRALPQLGAVYVKDFVWEGRRPQNVPLGSGQVDTAFFPQLLDSNFQGPISLHVEYLPAGSVSDNLQALKTDLATLRRHLAVSRQPGVIK